MFRMVILLAVLVLGCAGDIPDIPDTTDTNVYQPADSGAGCPEIEYRWTNDTGQHQAFYDGSGGFCTSIPSLDPSLQARCVARSDSGEILGASEWVDAIESTVEKFRSLCPL